MNFGTKKGNHERTRLYPGVRGRRPDLKSFRQKEALQRQQQYDTLSVELKLELLDRRPGESKKQRARLKKLLSEKQQNTSAKNSKKNIKK